MVQIRGIEAGSVVVTLKVVGFSGKAGADAATAALLKAPPTEAFGKCVVMDATTVTASAPSNPNFEGLSDLSESDLDKQASQDEHPTPSKDGLPDLSEIQKPGPDVTGLSDMDVEQEDLDSIPLQKSISIAQEDQAASEIPSIADLEDKDMSQLELDASGQSPTKPAAVFLKDDRVVVEGKSGVITGEHRDEDGKYAVKFDDGHDGFYDEDKITKGSAAAEVREPAETIMVAVIASLF